MGKNPDSDDAPQNPFEVKGLSTSRVERFGGESGDDATYDRTPITPYSKKQPDEV